MSHYARAPVVAILNIDMIKSEPTVSSNFDRPKLLLFKFLAHQIHPFAYAVTTFLRPALDDCLGLMHTNPQDTFNVLLSLSQTFTRFAPESELIYDDIQQFAVKLKEAIDQCFKRLDAETIQQSTQLFQTAQDNLLEIIQQRETENTIYTNMYKNMSAVLTNLEKINSLPTEIQTIDKGIPFKKPMRPESVINIHGRKDPFIPNQYAPKTITIPPVQTTAITPPPGMFPFPNEPLPMPAPPPTANPPVQSRLPQSVVIPPVDQLKTLPVPSAPTPVIMPASRPVSTVSYLNEYEVLDTSTQPLKKPVAAIASFPPRQNASLFTSSAPASSSTGSYTNGHGSSSLLNEAISNNQPWSQAKTNGISKAQPRSTPTPSIDGSVRLGNTNGLRTASVTPSFHDNIDDDWEDFASRPYSSNHQFGIPNSTSSEWRAPKDGRASHDNLTHFNQTKSISHPHITDEYIQEFGSRQNRPMLRGELCMTFGTPQSGPQTTCMPIGVGLSYDELTLLSCDVHRSAQHVRLFDIQTGRLKHTICSNQQMKFHRPGAIMSNPRDNILIVERDSIYVTEPDGRWVQTLTHRSIKQLYGIAAFHDRYILTIDSKASDNQSPESCRLLLFDPSSGQMVFDQKIGINQQSENALTSQYTNHIHGRILPEATTKPRFLAVHNDDIYIADLGRSLIYGASLRNQFDLTCTTVFGGNGRANGEMHDPAGLFIDSGGNIINADSKNDRVQLFSSDGQYKTTFKLNERIKRPSGICANRAGTQFYVSCYLAGCVRAFDIGY